MAKIQVEVVYIGEFSELLVSLQMEEVSTVKEAVLMSKILEIFPEILNWENKLGIFGKLVSPDTLLKEGDRIEIYRLLKCDPKAARRKRAAALRKIKK